MPIVACTNCGARNRVDERAATMQPVCGRCGAPLPGGSADPLVVTEQNFASVLQEAGARPVLIDCWAPWCGPCRSLTPVIDALAADAAERYVVGKLNVDENPGISQRLGIQGIPALVIFKGGREVDRLVGAHPRRAIETRLLAHVEP